MLQTLLDRLADGEFETSITLNNGAGPTVLKVRIQAADQVGIVASVKGMMGGWSDPVAYPWPAIARVGLEK
jgi:hypothetical protein